MTSKLDNQTVASSKTSTSKNKIKRIKINIVYECNICTEKYDTKKHRRIVCQYCPMEACLSCYERYILDKTNIKCMSLYCNREWSHKYVLSNFSNSFITGPLTKHRKNILFNNEKSKFPETLEIMSKVEENDNKLLKARQSIERFNYKKHFKKGLKETKKMLKTKYNGYYDEENFGNSSYHILHFLNVLWSKYTDNNNRTFVEYTMNIYDDDMDDDQFIFELDFIREINEFIEIFTTLTDINIDVDVAFITIEKMREDIKNIMIPPLDIRDKLVILSNHIREKKRINISLNTHQHFVATHVNKIKCPMLSCNGLLNDKMHCILCKSYACSSCHELKSLDEEHKCNPDTVETVNMLKTDTKSCPKCQSSIYKIDGCDQMWCTQCHTAFSWKTGIVETKIHNPHYYEWMRKNSANGAIPREIGDNPHALCNAEINNDIFTSYFDLVKQNYTDNVDLKTHGILVDVIDKLSDEMGNCIREVCHLRENVLPDYQNIDMFEEFKKRKDYLLKKINEDQYKKFLYHNMKIKIAKKEVSQLVQMFIDVKSDIVRRVMGSFTIKTENENANDNTILIAILDNIHNQLNILKEVKEINNYVKTISDELQSIYKIKIKL
jgi:hypothetical protein